MTPPSLGRIGWAALCGLSAAGLVASAAAAPEAPVLVSTVRLDAPAAADPDPAARTVTLSEAYALALQRSETIAIHQEQIAEVEGRFMQALGAALPRVSYEISEMRQDGTGGSAFTLKRIPMQRFVFSQPLFSGFKEFAAMGQTRAEKRQRRLEKTRAEHLLFVDVSDAYYFLQEHQQDLAALEDVRKALEQRIDELKDRERLGRSRMSEIASAEVRLRQVEAEIEQVKSDTDVARELIEFLTGLPRAAVADPADVSQITLAPEGDYLSRVPDRPDVLAAEQAVEAAKKTVRVAQADFWPDVDLDGNYYTKRAGVAEDIAWDATLTVDVPIFQGGQVLGAVREAKSLARQAELSAELTRRQARLDVQNRYAQLRSALTRRKALVKALEAAETNYRLQSEDYRNGLVNNLDVLEALTSLQETRRDVLRSTNEVQRFHRQLQAATGDLSDMTATQAQP